MKWKLGVGIAVCLAAMSFASPANAAADLTLNADLITSNTGQTGVDVASQLYVEVMDIGSSAQFTFFNTGPLASSITNIYWIGPVPSPLNFAGATLPDDWGSLASPGHLPGVQPMSVNWLFSVDPNAPVAPNGVHPGESATFTIPYAASNNINTLISALQSSNLQIGFHVQGMPGSESYLTTPGEIVPIPAPLGLAALGFAVVALRRRKSANAA